MDNIKGVHIAILSKEEMMTMAHNKLNEVNKILGEVFALMDYVRIKGGEPIRNKLVMQTPSMELGIIDRKINFIKSTYKELKEEHEKYIKENEDG